VRGARLAGDALPSNSALPNPSADSKSRKSEGNLTLSLLPLHLVSSSMSNPLDTNASRLQSVSLDTAEHDTSVSLLTSDAERVAVDAHFLASHSTVFKDLLNIGLEEGGERVCQVSETAEEINLLMQTLDTGKIEDHSARSLKVLARLGDKYDVLQVVEALHEKLL
jgi:hypothetical protein